MTENVNDYQVGGDHYRSEIQHWDYIEENGIGYLEGCATKYATRSRKKHQSPVEDLNKAIHYCKKLQSLHLAGKRNNRANEKIFPGVDSFAKANGLSPQETQVIAALTYWQDAGDLEDAIEVIENMLEKAIAAGDDAEEHH